MTDISGRDWDALSAKQKSDWHADPANDSTSELVRVLQSKQFNTGQDDIPIGVNIMHRTGSVYIDTEDRGWARVSRSRWIVINEDGVFISNEAPK